MTTLKKYIVAASVGLAGLAFSAAAQPAEAQYYSGWGHRPYYSRHFVPRHHYWHRPHYYAPRYYAYRPHVWAPGHRWGHHHYYPYRERHRSWGFGFHFGW